MKHNKPLVSIMIPNRNHSMYLNCCIESALNQTYSNIDIVVLDNCSDDNSIEIASKYINQGVRVCKNPNNIANKNYDVLTMLSNGEYMILLCADDIIKPTFIEKCINIMEKYPNVGYVHCERDYIDPEGEITELDFFYNCSFISPGNSVLPIYMLTDVGQPAQCLIRTSTFKKAGGFKTEFDHANADKDLWFRLSFISDYAYLREKLSLIRIHGKRETVIGYNSFYHPLAIYLMLDNQTKIGKLSEHKNVVDKFPAACKKLALESIHIAFHYLNNNYKELARQYVLFAQIIFDDIVFDNNYSKFMERYNNKELTEVNTISEDDFDIFKSRKRSYDPPEGFIKIG